MFSFWLLTISCYGNECLFLSFLIQVLGRRMRKLENDFVEVILGFSMLFNSKLLNMGLICCLTSSAGLTIIFTLLSTFRVNTSYTYISACNSCNASSLS